ECTVIALLRPFARLELLPTRGSRSVAEDMRMAPFHLVGDRARHVLECEMPGFLGHPGVEDHLKQQVAQFAAKIIHVRALDRVGDFVGFFDRVWRDAVEILRAIPGATVWA